MQIDHSHYSLVRSSSFHYRVSVTSHTSLAFRTEKQKHFAERNMFTTGCPMEYLLWELPEKKIKDVERIKI